jgi:hypothetical protein
MQQLYPAHYPCAAIRLSGDLAAIFEELCGTGRTRVCCEFYNSDRALLHSLCSLKLA